MEVSIIPSPEEIERYKTDRGGWTRSTLALWGVSFPPPDGWKESLEKAYKSGQTVGMILECVGCRKGKYFIDYDPYPVCVDCQEWERKRYEDTHSEKHINTVKPATKSITERVIEVFKPKKPKYKKEPIPADLRWAVFERDNFTCRHCGSRRNLSIDHIIPESKGGKLTMENTQTLCKSCNSRKGAR